MNAYFDFSNFMSLIHSANDNRYADCMRMLKDNFHIYFTFTKDSIEEASPDDKSDIMQWFTNMASGLGDISWNSGFPQNPIKADDLKKRANITSVYCLDETQRSDVSTLANKGTILVSQIGSELSLLSNLLVYSNQYTRNVFEEISKWEDIKNYISPTSDIIIYDRYLLSSPELYESNLYTLIKCLTNCVKNEKVNIVIVTLKDNFDNYSKRNFEPDWNEIYSSLRTKVNKKFRPNITFVVASKERIKHDRYIITNYKMFSSGDTYNYFNSQGEKITSGSWFHVYSLADNANMANANRLLKDVQELIDTLKRINDSNIMKDRICNFLEF